MPLTETLDSRAAAETESQPYRTPLVEPARSQLDELFVQLNDIAQARMGRRFNPEQKRAIAKIVGLLEEYGQTMRELTERVHPSPTLVRSALEEAGAQLSEVEVVALEQLKRRMIEKTPGSRRRFSEQNQKDAVAALRLVRKQRSDMKAFREQHGLTYALTGAWEQEYTQISTQKLVPELFPQPEPETNAHAVPPPPEEVPSSPTEVVNAAAPEEEARQAPAEAVVHETPTGAADQTILATVPECQRTPAETPNTIIATLRQQVAALTKIVEEMMQQNEMVMQAFAQRGETEKRQNLLPAQPTREVVEAVAAPSRIEAAVHHKPGSTEMSLTVDGHRIDIRSNAPFLLFPLLNGKASEQK